MAAASTNLVVAVPEKGLWRVSVVYWDFESRRDQFCALLRACNLDVIADLLPASKPAFFSYGTECGELSSTRQR